MLEYLFARALSFNCINSHVVNVPDIWALLSTAKCIDSWEDNACASVTMFEQVCQWFGQGINSVTICEHNSPINSCENIV